MDTIKIEMDKHPGTWIRVYVNDKLQVSSDNKNDIAKFVMQLIKYDAAIVPNN